MDRLGPDVDDLDKMYYISALIKMNKDFESEINNNIVEKIKKEPELAILLLNNHLYYH